MRRFLPLLLLAVVPALQGCFPVVATGVAAGALMADDRRTSGAYVEDEAIEIKVAHRIDEKLGGKVHIDVSSYNRHALLIGEVASEDQKAEAEEIAKDAGNVEGVTNEIAIGAPTSFSVRSSDSYITTKVKARFIDAKKFSANYVKVSTEAGVVYLQGLVTRQEAADAVEIARTTSDVKKVAKVFEYTD